MIVRPAPTKTLLGLLVVLALAACNFATAGASANTALPDPKLDAPASAGQGDQVAVFSGGCFWGVQAVFQHVKGVRTAVSGYAGGQAKTAYYEMVSTGETGHAESVKVTWDPSKVSYGQLLKVYFSVAHDPTQFNRQGPDHGTQYRSEIWYGNDQQKRIASAYIGQLSAAKAFPAPIVTQLAPLQAFYPAEGYHQDYARLHPQDLYIVYNDAPKVVHLKQLFPTLYVEPR